MNNEELLEKIQLGEKVFDISGTKVNLEEFLANLPEDVATCSVIDKDLDNFVYNLIDAAYELDMKLLIMCKNKCEIPESLSNNDTVYAVILE